MTFFTFNRYAVSLLLHLLHLKFLLGWGGMWRTTLLYEGAISGSNRLQAAAERGAGVANVGTS